MPVQFILGTSGTGKTRLILDQIIDRLDDQSDNSPLILLLPEQATYQAERAILSDRRIQGYNRLNVLSFQRLAFMLYGKYCQNRLLPKTSQQMIIAMLLNHLSDKLTVFRPSADSPGLAEKVARLITEMVSYSHDPEDIERLIEKLKKDKSSQITINKFNDLLLIYKHYQKFLEQRDFLDPDYQLTEILKKIPDTDFIKSASLWVDGFSDFTLQELAVLYELIANTTQTKISLCLDPESLNLPPHIEQTSIFMPTFQTYRALTETIVNQLKIKIEKPQVLKTNHRFKNNPPLAHIESNIFKDNFKKADSNNNIKIIPANDQRDEIEFAAQTICKLVRQQNYRYRDIAVIVSGLDQYRHFVQAVFSDYQIPFFIDSRHPLTNHPLSEFITSALNIAVKGFNSRDIFSYLKSGYANLDFQSTILLENYCLAFDITSKQWQDKSQWQLQLPDKSFDLQLINDIRGRAVEHLKKFIDHLAGDIAAKDFADALIQFFRSHDIENKLSNSSQLNSQIITHIDTLLSEIVEIYGDEKFSTSDFVQTFLTAFSQLKFAQIPPTLDQVLVGSIERSRHPEIKAAFLIGATQKQFPAPVYTQSLINEAERRMLETQDFTLSPPLCRQLLSRQYLAYIAFTRPGEKLYISYPLNDEKASPIQRSYFLSSLELLFNDDIKQSQTNCIDPQDILTKNQLNDFLCLNAGSDSPDIAFGEALLAQLTSIEHFCQFTDLANGAINYSNSAVLKKSFVDKLFPSQLKSSVSRLQTFAACPFKYFAQYTLKLKTKPVMKITPLDLGDFYHKVIEIFSKKLLKQNINFHSVSPDQLNEILNQSISQHLTETNFISNYCSHSRHNAYIIEYVTDLLEQFIAALAQHSAVSKFDLFDCEMGFGFDANDEFQIDLGSDKKLLLRGKIDRLDICKDQAGRLGMIIDYKTSSRSLSWSNIYHGLDIQLPAYLLAGKFSGIFIPAGAFFMPIEVKIIKDPDKFNYKLYGIFNGEFATKLDGQTTSGSSPYYNFSYSKQDQQYGRYSTSGTLKQDDFQNLLNFTEKKIKSLACQILTGKIDITPYRLKNNSPCSNCDYKSLCRFDWQVNKYNFLEEIDKPTLLEDIK